MNKNDIIKYLNDEIKFYENMILNNDHMVGMKSIIKNYKHKRDMLICIKNILMEENNDRFTNNKID